MGSRCLYDAISDDRISSWTYSEVWKCGLQTGLGGLLVTCTVHLLETLLPPKLKCTSTAELHVHIINLHWSQIDSRPLPGAHTLKWVQLNGHVRYNKAEMLHKRFDTEEMSAFFHKNKWATIEHTASFYLISRKFLF